MRLINPSKLPVCDMDRVICHWSEGHYKANDTDLNAYHILIEGDGTVRFGTHSIADNTDTTDGDYAAHTKKTNTGSIGVACCCMVGCDDDPYRPGPEPMRKEQWETMTKVVAELCEFYKIPVTPKTVLGHGEVQYQLKRPQDGKWDPMVFPWDVKPFHPDRPETHGGGVALRATVQAHLDFLRGAAPQPVAMPTVRAVVSPLEAIPVTDSFNLRSKAFAGNVALEAVADGHRALRPTGSRVEGIELVQDALNRLASSAPGYRIDVGNHRGWFGQRTEDAVLAFQDDFHLTTDGVVGRDTIRRLDEAMVELERGDNPLAGTPAHVAAILSSGYTPPAASASAVAGINFATGDATPGAEFMKIYAAADRKLAKGDPSRCRALLRFPDGTVFFESKMAICADGSPRAKQIDPGPGNPKTAFTYPKMAGGYFDAEDVPYIVLPGGSEENDVPGFAQALGIGKLDLAVVIYRGQVTPAFYGEVGPWFRIGEASIRVHEQLPVPSPWTSSKKLKVLNSSVEKEVLCFVFPKTAVARPGTMDPADWVKASCKAALAQWDKFRAGGSIPPMTLASLDSASSGDGVPAVPARPVPASAGVAALGEGDAGNGEGITA